MIKSYSKVNLFLKVLSKNKKGLHNIQTISVLTSLHDQIEIKKINNNKDQINFLGNFKKDISKTNNSVTKTLQILRDYKFIKKQDHFEINIYKNIPVFAGLGGGTSNAYFIAKHFIKKKFNKKLIKLFENKIGSDFSLFLFKKSVLKSLNRVEILKEKTKLYFAIVFPKIKCSTKQIYASVKKYNTPISNSIFSKIKSKNFLDIIFTNSNDLENIVRKKYKKIDNLIKLISTQKNCLFARMTGSGSACFGLFLNAKSAQIALHSIRKKYGKDYCFFAKCI
ncbi:MAG: 4-(cytidine 5'-diphospho)-2-C-methyl-D-erythritol kinase [Pelagibacteraceae bacterium]